MGYNCVYIKLLMCFSVVLPHRTYLIQASTVEDLNSWIDMINWKIVCNLDIFTLLTKITAGQNEVALCYDGVRGLYFPAFYFCGDYSLKSLYL